MKKFRTKSLNLLLFMTFALPILLMYLVYYQLSGFSGFAGLVVILHTGFVMAPILFAVLLTFYILIRTRPDVKQFNDIGAVDSVMLLLLYVSVTVTIFLYSINLNTLNTFILLPYLVLCLLLFVYERARKESTK